jgi:hypothetical protein
MKPSLSVWAYVKTLTDWQYQTIFGKLHDSGFIVPDIRWLLLALLFFGRLQLMATSVVVFWMPDFIVIAADSKGTSLIGDQPIEICKIRQESTAFYSFAGLYEDFTVGFNIPEIVHKSFVDADGNLRTKFFVANAQLTLALVSARVQLGIVPGPGDARRQNYSERQIIFSGWDNGSLVMSYRDDIALADQIAGSGFSTIGAAKGNIDVPDGKSSFEHVVLGEHRGIDAYKAANPNWMQFDLVGLARRFVEVEKIASPDTVGFSTVILTINPDGARWIQQGTCPNIAKEVGPPPRP